MSKNKSSLKKFIEEVVFSFTACTIIWPSEIKEIFLEIKNGWRNKRKNK